MASRRVQRQYAFVLSVLGHGAIVVALTFSIPLASRDRPAAGSDVVPIETYLVDEGAIEAEMARIDAEKEAAAEAVRREAERRQQEQAELERVQRVQAEEAARQEREKLRLETEAAAERQRAEELERERIRQEQEALARKQAEEERKRREEEQRRQEQLAREREEEARRQREAEEAARRAAVQAEIDRAIAAEQAARAARDSGMREQWALAIKAKVERYWNRPPNVGAELECVLIVTQLPDGSVTNVVVERCNSNDPTILRSLENAVLNAAPLPERPRGVPFERQIRITFRPTE